MPPVIKFNLSIYYDRKSYALEVEVTRQAGNRLELASFTSGGKVFVMESDRPFCRQKNLWKRNYTVKLIQGHTFNVTLLERVVEALKDVIRSYEVYDPDYINPKNRIDPEEGKDFDRNRR